MWFILYKKVVCVWICVLLFIRSGNAVYLNSEVWIVVRRFCYVVNLDHRSAFVCNCVLAVKLCSIYMSMFVLRMKYALKIDASSLSNLIVYEMSCW